MRVFQTECIHLRMGLYKVKLPHVLGFTWVAPFSLSASLPDCNETKEMSPEAGTDRA